MPQITLGEPVLVEPGPGRGQRNGAPGSSPTLNAWPTAASTSSIPRRGRFCHRLRAAQQRMRSPPTMAKPGRPLKAATPAAACCCRSGDRLLPIQLQSRNRNEGGHYQNQCVVQEDAPNRITHIYRAADLPAELSGWRFLRLRSGDSRLDRRDRLRTYARRNPHRPRRHVRLLALLSPWPPAAGPRRLPLECAPYHAHRRWHVCRRPTASFSCVQRTTGIRGACSAKSPTGPTGRPIRRPTAATASPSLSSTSCRMARCCA